MSSYAFVSVSVNCGTYLCFVGFLAVGGACVFFAFNNFRSGIPHILRFDDSHIQESLPGPAERNSGVNQCWLHPYLPFELEP